MITFKKIALGCAVATLAVSASAMANVQTKLVHYDDLDLSTSAGQQRLAIRVKSAVKSVCGPRAFSLAEKQDLIRCQRDATASAMPKLERTVARYQEAKRLATNDSTAIVGN